MLRKASESKTATTAFYWEKTLSIKELNNVKDLSTLKKTLLLQPFFKNNRFADIVNLTDSNKISFLMFAAANDCHRVIEALISGEVNINFQGKDGATALHVACELGKGNAVETLLMKAVNSIDISILDNNKKTAQDLANELNPDIEFEVETPFQSVRDPNGALFPSPRTMRRLTTSKSKEGIKGFFEEFQILKATCNSLDSTQKRTCKIL